MSYLLIILYILFVVFHMITTWIFFVCLVRVFVVKFSPYSSLYVGATTLANALYGGCPFTEIENALARLVGAPQKLVGEIYFMFGDWHYLIRFVLFFAAIGLLYNSYKVWHKAKFPLRVENIFMRPKKSLVEVSSL